MDEDKVMNEVTPAKKTFKDTKFCQWCRAHSGEIITVFGGVCTVAGAIINLCTKKYEEDSYVYTTTKDGDVYRLKAKKLPTQDSTDIDD